MLHEQTQRPPSRSYAVLRSEGRWQAKGITAAVHSFSGVTRRVGVPLQAADTETSPVCALHVLSTAAHLAHQLYELLQAQLKLQAALDLLQPAPVISTPGQCCAAVVLLQSINHFADISKDMHV